MVEFMVLTSAMIRYKIKKKVLFSRNKAAPFFKNKVKIKNAITTHNKTAVIPFPQTKETIIPREIKKNNKCSMFDRIKDFSVIKDNLFCINDNKPFINSKILLSKNIIRYRFDYFAWEFD